MSPLSRVLAAVLLIHAAACSDGGDGTAPTTTSSQESPGSTSALSSTSVAPPVAAAWRPRATAPTARQEVASAVLDGRVWVIGGLTAAGASDVVEIYDPATDQWTPGPALPAVIHHASAAAYRGEVVVLGGFLAGASLYARPSDRALALRGGAWVDLPRLRRPRGAASAAVVGGALVVAGGRDGATLVGPTEIFEGATWRDGQALPTRRDHLSAVSDGRSLFTVGGRFLSPGALSAALERYDPVADAWERLPAMPTARGGQGATYTGGRVVVAGGEDPNRVYAEVEAYDVAARTWSALAPMPTPRHGLAVESVGTMLLALVGGSAFGVAPSARAEALGPLS